jgi:hypothetical protein
MRRFASVLAVLIGADAWPVYSAVVSVTAPRT